MGDWLRMFENIKLELKLFVYVGANTIIMEETQEKLNNTFEYY